MRSFAHRFLTYILLLVASTVAVSCKDKKEEPRPEPTPPHRTVLVYMVADNSLGSMGYDQADINEMIAGAQAGALNGGRLLVYRASQQYTYGAPKLIEITPEGEIVTLKEYDAETYSVDPARMEEVLADVERLAPADGLGLVLWSHANGWLGATPGTENRYKAFGDDRGQYMTIQSLGRVLSGRGLDFIYADCCLMGNIETAYELRNATSVFVASPTELGLEGMPYTENLPCLFATVPDMVQAAKNTFEWYSSRSKNCQMTVIDTSALERLAAESRRLWHARTGYPDVTGIQTYVRNGSFCHAYDMEAYYELLGADDAWRAALADAVVYMATTPTAIGPITMRRYCGLGSGAIRSEEDITYRGYDTTQWWQALDN